jgi:hypothetical protein
MEDSNQPSQPTFLARYKFKILGLVAAVIVFCVFYVRTHPLIFNESFLGHAHCIKLMSLALDSYAADHDGHYPADTNGYGNALLQLTSYTANFWEGLTGPGYNGKVFKEAARTGLLIPESECGRVYVQGLSETNNPEIALFFDKLPSPGGDHCHFPWRLYAPLVREVCTVGSGGGYRVIRESEWKAYATNQIELLVTAGVPRKRAEEYYAESPKPPTK